MLKLFSRYGITIILKLKKEMRNNWNKATVERDTQYIRKQF